MLRLAGGQAVSVGKLKSFELTDPGDGSFGVVLTFLDGRVISDSMDYVAGVGGYCQGQGDLGPLNLNMRSLKKIEFQR
jgi:hypothetical protein